MKYLLTLEENWKSCVGSVGEYIRSDFESRKLLPSADLGDCNFDPAWNNRWVDNFIKYDAMAKFYPAIMKSYWYTNPFYYRTVLYGEDPVNPSFMSGLIPPESV
jgi:hypothetical protein